MKKIFAALLLIFSFAVQVSAQTPFTAPLGFNYSAPTGAPSALGTRVRFDITTGRIYTWSPDALNWQLQGYTIDQISGTSAPAYAPVRGQSWFAVNGDTLPRLYQYTGMGTTWKCLNCSNGKTYTAGTGITLSGPNLTVINNAGDLSNTNELNTGFDVSGGNLRIIDAGATRTVPVTTIAPDQSVTNEIQQIDTLRVNGANLELSLSSDGQPAKTLAVSSIAPVQALANGTGISITGTTTKTITNSAPDQTVAITGAGSVAVSGTYPSFTVTGNGISALTGDVTATGPGSAAATIAAGAVTAAKIASMGASTGQVLFWNGTSWAPTSTFPQNSTAFTPALYYSGAWYTGGTTTSTKPHILIEPSGVTSNNWSSSGTGIGVNAASAFTGNLIDLQQNGSSKIKIDNAGSITHNGFSFVSTVSGYNLFTGSNGVFGNYVSQNAFTVKNLGGSSNAFQIRNSVDADLLVINQLGKPILSSTNTATGTTGAQTINKASGTVNIAAGQSSIVVTNSLATTSSIVFPVILTNDATAVIKNVVRASGSFTINLTATATAETAIGFFVIN